MQPRAGRRASERTSHAKLVALWTVIAVAGAGFAAAGVMTITAPPDAAALCESGTVAASTLILVDTSDTLSEIQRRRVKATIETERDRLRAGEKLTILIMNSDSPGEPLEVLSACSPGRPQDANPLFVTRSKIDARWSAAFADPIDDAITEASAAPEAESSPLVQTIAAALTRPDFDARVPSRRLVIASDMMQHQKGGYSQVTGGDFWQAYARSELVSIIDFDLRGVAIAIDYLLREKYARVQGDQHRDFWRQLFSESGASEVSFIGMLPSPSQDRENNAATPPSEVVPAGGRS